MMLREYLKKKRLKLEIKAYSRLSLFLERLSWSLDEWSDDAFNKHQELWIRACGLHDNDRRGDSKAGEGNKK